MHEWWLFVAQLVGVVFVILSADRLFQYRRLERLDGRMSPEKNDRHLVWFVFVIGLVLVFMPSLLQSFSNIR